MMKRDDIQVVGMTAAEARRHLGELCAERAASAERDVIGTDAYRRGLDAEIELWSNYYVTAAVTEMATLRAELGGANVG